MKTVIRITIGLMMFLAVGVTSLWAIASPNYSKAQRFTNVVSSLPISTSKDRIERLLQKEGLEYSYVSDRNAIDRGAGRKPPHSCVGSSLSRL
jgi:hypothetical protein